MILADKIIEERKKNGCSKEFILKIGYTEDECSEAESQLVQMT